MTRLYCHIKYQRQSQYVFLFIFLQGLRYVISFYIFLHYDFFSNYGRDLLGETDIKRFAIIGIIRRHRIVNIVLKEAENGLRIPERPHVLPSLA